VVDEGQWGRISVSTVRDLNGLFGIRHLGVVHAAACRAWFKSISGKTIANVIGMLDRAVPLVPSLSNRAVVVVEKEQAFQWRIGEAVETRGFETNKLTGSGHLVLPPSVGWILCGVDAGHAANIIVKARKE